MQKGKPARPARKPQSQNRPGKELKMKPQPEFDRPEQPGSGRLRDKVALITGGDSGIGKAVAVLFAKEGADVAISYLDEDADARHTKEMVENRYGRSCLLLPGDVSRENHCRSLVKKTIKEYGRIDILVNNAAIHYEHEKLEDIPGRELQKTFAVNVFSFFWITQEALKHMKEGSSIINTTSVVAYRGSGGLIDYAATKGAIVSFTRSLSANLVNRGIRVNAVAPGPVWTPLIVSSFAPGKVAKFGTDCPMGRAGEPVEIAGSYVFLASEDASFITGQVIHANGGEIVNG